MKVKQERARRTREQVLDAAAAEFALRGYPRATLEGIAARAGVTKGAVYGHFGSKEQLADAVVGCGEAVFGAVLAEVRPSAGCCDDELPGLRELFLGLRDRLAEDVRVRAAARLLMERADEDRLASGALLAFEERLRALLEASMADRCEACSPDLAARALLAIALGVRPYESGPNEDRLWRLAAAMLPVGLPCVAGQSCDQKTNLREGLFPG